MGHIPIIKVAGLHTNNNELSAVPEGGLAVANDVVIRAKDVIEPRRGQHIDTTIGADTRQGFTYNEDLIVNAFDGDAFGELGRVVDGAYTAYTGEYLAPSEDQRMRSLETSGNVYFTTSRGVYKLDEVTGTPVAAGAPKTADLSGFFNTDRDLGITDPGFLEAGNKVAYRVVFVRTDANNNVLIGSPSGRCFSINTHATDSTNVQVGVFLPDWIVAGDLVRIYRTSQVASDSDPGDEMALVKETKLTSTHIGSGYYSTKDKQPDDLRGVALYTNNNSGEGILQANEPPPLAHDICYWNNRLWFANTAQPQRLFLDVLGVGAGETGATGVRLGDVLTVAGQKFVGYFSGDGETFPTLDYTGFPVYSDQDAAQNIESTARSFISTLNEYGTEDLRAYYISGASDVPGKIVIEALEPNTDAFSVTIDTYAQQISTLTRAGTTVTMVTVSRTGLEVGDTFTITATTPNANFSVGTKTVVSKTDDYTITYTEAGVAVGPVSVVGANYRAQRLTPNPGLAWNPELPKTDGTSGFTVTSEAEIEVQRLYYSKLQQPEAVPLVNYFDVGIKGRKILRVLPLKDKLFVLKEDGMYLVSGEAPYIVDLLDNTAHLIAPDTANVVNNQIFGLTNQGVVSVSEGGVTVVSRAIEPSILQLFNEETFSDVKTNSFSVSRETDRLYELWLPDLENEHTTSQAFVYNTMLGVWTRYVLNRTFGVVNPTTDILYMGDGDAFNVVTERRNFDSLDYFDEELTSLEPQSINVSARQLEFTPIILAQLGVGDVFFDQDSPGVYYVIETVDTEENLITYRLNTVPLAYMPDLITVYKAIPSQVEWATQNAGSNNDLKQFTEVHFLFRKAHFGKAQATFGTDVVPTRESIEFDGNNTNPADTVNWSEYDIPFDKRILVGSQHQYATFFRPGLSICEALAYWTLSGVTINFTTLTSTNGQ
jgi:hypothetical protein